jgi:hypothetical protein
VQWKYLYKSNTKSRSTFLLEVDSVGVVMAGGFLLYLLVGEFFNIEDVDQGSCQPIHNWFCSVDYGVSLLFYYTNVARGK